MKKLVLSIVLLSLTIVCQSQKWKGFPYPRKHSISFGIDGGLGGVLINGSFLTPTNYSWASGFDLVYTRMLNEEWGLQFGLGARYLTGAYHMNDLSSEFVAPISMSDGEHYHNEDANFVYVTKDAHEFYSMPLIEVPIRLSYTNESWHWSAGVKLALPVTMSADYDYSEGIIGINEVVGTGTMLDEMLPVGSFPARSGSYAVCGLLGGKPTLFASLSLEAGYRISLGGTHSLMASLFADYAINQNRLGCEGDDDFITFKDGVPTYGTCMGSNEIMGFNYFTAGLRISYQFGYGDKVGEVHVKYHPHVYRTTPAKYYRAKRKLRKLTRRSRFKLF